MTKAETMDSLFKYKIGDMVCTRSHNAWVTAEGEINKDIRRLLGDIIFNVSLPLMIVERTVQECHGGVQLHYVVSGYQDVKSGGPTRSTLSELEVMPFEQAVAARKAHADSMREQMSK